jgi:peptidoglycan/xylan/chitin deacetylase (PgdA/CDA1 family)
MDRRTFCKSAAAAAFLTRCHLTAGEPQAEIAFTFDDPKTTPAYFPWQETNRRILETLSKRKLQAVLFVCGKRVDSAEGRELISAWDHAGHRIGNHSYSHLYFHASGPDAVSLAEFESDMLKNEPLIRSYPNFVRLFRFPFFKEGDTKEKRDGMRAFLREHGYRNGRATIDASDWAIDARLARRAKTTPALSEGVSPYRQFFLEHIWERAQFYDSLARRVLDHPVRHTLLLHHSALNALFLDDLIAMFIARGWKPVDATWAYQDPVYDQQPQTLPAGESLIWALAKQTGKFETELRYPGEDDTYENPKMDALKL